MFLVTSGILNFPAQAVTLAGDYSPGAHVAYSLRKVVSAYTGAVVRVRRSSDNTEQDFTATQLTDGTIEIFIGAGNGFVRTLYNQTATASRNLEQSTQAAQPIIAESGVVYKENGKPSMKFDGNRWLGHGNASNWVFLHIYPCSIFSVQKIELSNPNTLYGIWATGSSTTQRAAYLRYEDRSSLSYNNDWVHVAGSAGTTIFNQKSRGTGDFVTQKLITARVHSDLITNDSSFRSYVGVDSKALANLNAETRVADTNNPTHGLRIGEANGSWRLVGAFSELIIYYYSNVPGNNMRTQDSAIDQEMKNYYAIT